MAKRARTSVITVPRSQAPIIRVSAPRAPSAPRRSRRRSGGGRRGESGTSTIMKVAVGGAILGFLEKQGTAIPTVPVLGRAGTIAIAAYFFGGKRPGMARDICIAATAIAASQLARDGKISGEDD